MNRKDGLGAVRDLVVLAAVWTACGAQAWGLPQGLLFHVSFDKLTTTADHSGGDGRSTFTASLELRPAEGVEGAGLLQQRGERCSYPGSSRERDRIQRYCPERAGQSVVDQSRRERHRHKDHVQDDRLSERPG